MNIKSSKPKFYDVGNKFTISTKRYELRHGKIPKENEKKEWSFRIINDIFSFNAKYINALSMAKDIAEHKEYYFIELVP